LTTETEEIKAGRTYTFEFFFEPGTRVRYYFNDVLLGILTTNLPADVE
jgi:hypothetical protein